jgi:hypothetical protein
MTEAQIALARRLVAAPGWRWLPGMQVRTTHAGGYPKTPAGTPVRIESDSTLPDCVTEGKFGPIAREPAHTHPDFGALCDLHDKSVAEAEARILPDLSDPLTALGLLALVRERWAMPNLAAVRKDGAWMLWAGGLPDALYLLRAPTELEVLILALEVSP